MELRVPKLEFLLNGNFLACQGVVWIWALLQFLCISWGEAVGWLWRKLSVPYGATLGNPLTF